MTGLRERKKQRTRDELIRAALELFVAQGYDHTTIDAITDTVDVSQRTFFRYFAGKEEVAFALQDMIETHFLAAVRLRPPDEPPLRALRNALESVWDGIGATIERTVPVSLFTRMWQVIETTPTLLAAQLRRSSESNERLAAEIARRQGVALETDPRPRVLVTAVTAVMQTAAGQWGAGEDITLEAARAQVLRHLDQLVPALSDDWRPPPAAPDTR